MRTVHPNLVDETQTVQVSRTHQFSPIQRFSVSRIVLVVISFSLHSGTMRGYRSVNNRSTIDTQLVLNIRYLQIVYATESTRDNFVLSGEGS